MKATIESDIISSGATENELKLSTELPTESRDEKQARESDELELRQLIILAKSPAWERMRAKFVRRIEELEKFDDIDIEKQPFEEIGRAVVVNKGSAAILRSFLSEVDNSVEEEQKNA